MTAKRVEKYGKKQTDTVAAAKGQRNLRANGFDSNMSFGDAR
jgi:hypothetical protein